MIKSLRLVACATAYTLFSLLPASGLTYKVHYLPCGDTGSVAYGINSQRQVVGRLGNEAALWDTDGSVRILPRPEGASGYFMAASSINDSGLVAAGRRGGHGAVWASDGSVVTGGSGHFYSDVNSDGVVAGWVSGATVLEDSAVTWTASGTHYLGSMPDWLGSRATAMNNHGDVVGYAYVRNGDGSTTHAFLWKANGDILEITDSGSRIVDVYDINDLGQIVGMVWGTGIAFVWSPGSSILSLGPGRANAINNAGTVVGCFSGTDPRDPWDHACVWNPATGRIDLGWGTAYGINEAGWIAGCAGVSRRAVFWEPVPEPSSGVAVLSALGLIAAVRFRKR